MKTKIFPILLSAAVLIPCLRPQAARATEPDPLTAAQSAADMQASVAKKNLASGQSEPSAFDQAAGEKTFQAADLLKAVDGVKYPLLAETVTEMNDMGMPRNFAKEKADKACKTLLPGSSSVKFTVKSDAVTRKLYLVSTGKLVDVQDACVIFSYDFAQQLPTSQNPAVQKFRAVLKPAEMNLEDSCRAEVVDSAAKNGLALDPANYASMDDFNKALVNQSKRQGDGFINFVLRDTYFASLTCGR